MDADNKMLLKDIIGGSKKQYKIPVYQRNYSWEKKECATLFDDISKINEANGRKTHFIGTIVFIRDSQNSVFDFDKYYLIDGQQRLTTTVLLLKAIYDELRNKLGEDNSTVLDIKETLLTNSRIEGIDLKLRLKPNDKDNVIFQKIMTSDYHNIDKTNTMFKNFTYFRKEIEKLDDIQDFLRKMYKLSVVFIDLNESEDNPQLIFESLNSKNKKLHEADLIRNFVLMDKSPEMQETFFLKYWRLIETNVGENQLTDFIRNYLIMITGQVVNKNDIYNSFKDYVFSEIDFDTEVLLIDLLRYSESYGYLTKVKEIGDKSILETLDDLHGLQFSQTYPFLLKVFDDYLFEKVSANTLIKILKVIESYMFRRSLLGVQSGSLSNKMAKLPKIMSRINNIYKNYFEYFASLMVFDKSAASFPRDGEILSMLESKDMYKFRNKQYFFTKLENSFNPKEKIPVKNNYQIEHIIPQTLSEKWEKKLGPDGIEKHEKLVNNLGNLTLTQYNPEMKNYSYEKKLEYIKKSRLNLNASLSKITDFTLDNLDDRTVELADLTIEVWPLPKASNKYFVTDNLLNIYRMSDDIVISDEKPNRIYFGQQEIKVSSWNEFYIQLIKHLLNTNEDISNSVDFKTLVQNKGYATEFVEVEDFENYEMIRGLYYFTERSFANIKDIVIHLCEVLDFDINRIKYRID